MIPLMAPDPAPTAEVAEVVVAEVGVPAARRS
jgi:hypothetical protein